MTDDLSAGARFCIFISQRSADKNMDSSSGEVYKSGEELSGRKKSRFKQLKTRLFGKLKKKESEGLNKQSQSASDINAPEDRREGYDSEDEFSFPQGFNSRALSHDSIFITEQTPSTEPARVLSQENVHGKIKALQLKLQQQNLHLGPPPMLIPGKRIEDSGATSEDDGLPCSPPETCFHERVMQGAVYKKHLSSLSLAGTGSEEEEQGDPFQPSSRPLSPVSRPSPQPIISPASGSTTPTAGVDFSSPASYMPGLDNSAARHRMSVKPRNQRASTRGKRGPAVSLSPRHRSESISDLDNVLSEEEDDETTTSTETVHHCLYSSPSLELTEKPSSPEPTETTPAESAQDQEENLNLNRTQIILPSLGVEILKSEESLETEGRVTTNPLYLQPMSFGLISSRPPSPLGRPESPTPQRGIESLRAHSPLQTQDINDIQIHTSENHVSGTDKNDNIQGESTFRRHPVPLPHLKKPKIDISSPPSPKGAAEPSTKPWEAGVETASELDSRMLNAGSLFLIASAKHRSKASTETKQNEGHLKHSPEIKTQPIKPNPELQKDEEGETKPTELQNHLHQTQETKSSFHREVPPPVISKPITGTNPRKADAAAEHVETEEPEDKGNAFGVQLRTTSLSLKYRSEVSKIKDETKRYSLESNAVTAVSEEHAGKAETNSKSKKLDPQKLDSPPAAQDNGKASIQNTTGACKEAVSKPGWMSLAREKTKAHQPFLDRLATNQSPAHPTSPTAPPAQPPKPALQPKTQPLTPSLHPLKAASLQTSQSPPTKPAPSGTNDWQDKGRNNSAEDDTTKKAAKLTSPNNATETLTVPPAASSSSTDVSSQQQQQQQRCSDGAQPSWMELAKRKSLAWSDKTLELS
ncbi:CRACD-like protein isoform X2 [Carassius gibelio]|uniref:CRACD-like protein isoform X2 n=1 Tax=Carassius gibelio TaxID=101364 RepID=UPI00227831DD|nr:CRACD-like protein isoform X2 [Carassius gibelio]